MNTKLYPPGYTITNVTHPGGTELPDWETVLAVIAHPDDESFGLGAVIDAFIAAGATVDVLCLTRGEASTLGADQSDLPGVRAREITDAAGELGVRSVRLLDFPDGALETANPAVLAGHVVTAAIRPGRRGSWRSTPPESRHTPTTSPRPPQQSVPARHMVLTSSPGRCPTRWPVRSEIPSSADPTRRSTWWSPWSASVSSER